ncbi:MAG: response regulator transcription factor [Candidatus Krumholzibacteriota bacterium]|nr:response regulator transcription factor [Candidatus Krumholzibacteriota bacterium]
MKNRCIIVDDEPLAIEVIANHLERFSEFEIASTCANAAEALEVLKSEKIDLMFLDIQMPDIKGTDFLRLLDNPPAVIFTTAYRDFALEGYELSVLDYLVKPVSFDRFMKAINRYLDSRGKKKERSAADEPIPSGNGYINVKSERKTVRVPLDRIIYLEAMKDYVNIVSTDGHIMTNTAMHILEAGLPPENFLRIHRSYVVSIDRVNSFNSEMIETGKKQLPIGRSYKKRVMKILESPRSG